MYEFYEKYPGVTHLNITPKYNNEELFLKYGLSINNNKFDNFNLNIDELVQNQSISVNDKYNDSYKSLKLSCDEDDLRNVLYLYYIRLSML